jgi:hypothetical protein
MRPQYGFLVADFAHSQPVFEVIAHVLRLERE